MSIQVPSNWEFLNTLLTWFENAAILIMFGFAWNFEHYQKKVKMYRLRKEVLYMLPDIEDFEFLEAKARRAEIYQKEKSPRWF